MNSALSEGIEYENLKTAVKAEKEANVMRIKEDTYIGIPTYKNACARRLRPVARPIRSTSSLR